MNKKLFSLFFLIFSNNVKAYQISSNHSYIKNSEFTSDHYININGYGEFIGRYVHLKKNDYPDITNKTTKTIFQTELSVDINVEKQIDEITTFGIHYIPVYNSNYLARSKYYLYVNGFYGNIEFGNNSGVFDKFRVGADTIALGTGGINSSFFMDSNLNSDHIYLLSPNSLLYQNFGLYNSSVDKDYWYENKYLQKINYISSEFYGFQFGFSVIPNVSLNMDHGGKITTKLISDLDLGNFYNYGINYINTFGNLGISASAVMENNNTNPFNINNGRKDQAYYFFNSKEFGLNINYFGWTLAASYGMVKTKKNENATSRTISTNTEEDTGKIINIDPYIGKKGNYKTYGFSYEIADISMSVTVFNSKYKNYSKFNSLSVALEKKMYKGYSLYTEYNKYKSEAKDRLNKVVKFGGTSVFFGVMFNFD